MSPELKSALVMFGRALFAAMVGAAIVYITGLDLSSVSDVPAIAKGLAIAVINAVLLFLGAWLRATTTEPTGPLPPATSGSYARVAEARGGPHLARTKSWADKLPI